jgi:hypothetical protein
MPASAAQYGNINTRYFYRDDSRNARLTFSYSFGNNKIFKTRERKTSSADETNRL